jgi:hypothetical protein
MNNKIKILTITEDNYDELYNLHMYPMLEELYCSGLGLDVLPSLRQNKLLRVLDCSDNQLMRLPNMYGINPWIKAINCRENQLMSLPNFPECIEYVDCRDNLLRVLPTLCRDNLTELYCDDDVVPKDLFNLMYLNGKHINTRCVNIKRHWEFTLEQTAAVKAPKPAAKPATNATEPVAKPATNATEPAAKPATNATEPVATKAATQLEKKTKIAAQMAALVRPGYIQTPMPMSI